MKHLFLIGVLVLFAQASYAEKLEIVGTGDGLAVFRALAKSFEAAHPEHQVVVPDSIGSSGGIRAVGEKKYRLARVARAIKSREQHYGLSRETLARSPVVFYAHPDSGLAALTQQAILDIFSGKINNWSQLGGANEKVRLVVRESTDSSYSVLKKTLPGFADIQFPAHHLTAVTTQEALNAVQTYAGAISFGPLNDAELAGLRVFSVDEKLPTDKHWRMYSELGFVYYPNERKGVVKQFLDYMYSPQAQKILKANHLIGTNAR